LKRIRILSAARCDPVVGYQFYEGQAEGIGRYFLDSLFSDIESLRIHAGVHAVVFGRYQRLLSRRFPWAVYDRIEDEEVRIFAVLDSRRDPSAHERRLVSDDVSG
jgi:plasmid stabilization system protein ParE